MSIVISINVPGLPTDPPKMDVESKKTRIKLRQEIGKPFVDDICRKLMALGINNFSANNTIFSVVISQDVSEEQLEIIRSWERVKSAIDGNIPISLILPVNRL